MKCPYCNKLILTKKQKELFTHLRKGNYSVYDLTKITGRAYSHVHGGVIELYNEGLLAFYVVNTIKNREKKMYYLTSKGEGVTV